MSREDIFNHVVEAVAETMGTTADALSEDTLLEDISADSLDRIELITQLEEDYDATVEDDVLTSIETLGDIVDAIENTLAAQE